MNELQQPKQRNSFRYENGKMTINGVTDVISFDEKQVVLRLTDGLITVRGNSFKMEEMGTKTGVFTMNGNVNSLFCHEKAEKTSFLNKIFK